MPSSNTLSENQWIENFESSSKIDNMVSVRESLAYTEQGAIASVAAPRIVLVEDDCTNQENFGECLFFLGYQVLCLADGSGLFQALADFQPHLIWLDLRLPDIDGYILLEQLQQSPQWRHIPVIVVSALASKADRDRALSLGAIEYLVKPVSLDVLEQVIQDILRDYWA